MRRFLAVTLLLLMASILIAKPISPAQATRVAENWMFERTGTHFANSTLTPLKDGSDLIFVVSLRPTGFILIAGDDASYPVLGYNTDHAWKEYPLPPQLEYLIGVWEDQLEDISAHRLPASLETTVLWSKYDKPVSEFQPNANYRDVSPLLTTIWGQGTYYNAQCPSGTPVGCVATAMAQIMRYWSFPVTGVGSHSYNCPPYGTQTADFGATTYNWSAMPNNVTSANAAVATISRHAGVAVDMQYAPDGSGAYSTDVPNALINYFRYASSTQYRNKGSYTPSVWEAMMKGEIDNARPVYYSGSSTGSGGHAWVLDGYSGSNFHVNWGWNGYYNGYFSLTALNPGTDNFSSGQAAVIGIAPTVTSLTISEGFEGTTFPPTGWATNGTTTFSRSTTSPITGTASAYYTNSSTISGVRLITPKLAVSGTSAPITFKAKRGNTNRLEQITVAYSTSNSGPWTNLTTFTPTATAATYTQATTGITPGNYFFALVPTSTNTNQAKAFWIDDVTGPEIATTVSLNITSWNAGNLAPGDQARSDNIFTLSNTGGGTLTVTSVTNLSSTEFTTNFNSSVNLVYGQTHDFGFTYNPLNYGADNVNFQIVTNAGTVTVALSGSATYAVFYDGFENYSDFSLTCPPWTQYDGDGLSTWGVNGYTWPNVNYTGSWMIFNPSMTTPSMEGSNPAYLGSKLASCWAANSATVANNDWLITPMLSLTTAGTVSFWGRSFSASYLESMNVKYSTTTNAISDFTNTLASVTNIPATWTSYSYAVPQNVKYIAIQCVSLDRFALWIDEFKVADSSTPPPPTFGNLEGYVYQYGTTTPIGNAVVTVGTKQAITNSFGYYQITNILTGTVSASCTTPGMFYHPSSATGIAITNGGTTSQNFGLTWGEIAANPTSVSASLYQGETGSTSVTLTNPGGTAPTLYAGYFASAVRGQQETAPFIRDTRKPAPGKHGTSINPITDAPAPDRSPRWYSYAAIGDANYYSGDLTERGNYFMLSDFAMIDGAITISQLRGYFYHPAGTNGVATWTTTTHRTFAWKIYSVSSTGTVALVHTSSNILLPSINPNTYTLNEYTLPSAITIPAGYDFIVVAKPSSATDTSGRPQSLATDITSDNGVIYDATNGWQFSGMNYLVDAYVDGTEWMTSYNFSGSINPGGSVVLPLNFNTIGVSAGTKNAYMYIYNDANYTAPSPRGDALVVPISLTVTVATTPVAVITSGTDWTTRADVGSPSNSGDIFTLKNVGPGNLTITSISGLAGTPFTTNFSTGTVLAQNATYSFGFTFTPTVTGIWTTTFTIVTNGGTKTITLKGYGNYIYESFEGTNFPPDGWQSVDNDTDTYNWFAYSVTDTPHTGTYCAASASWVSDAKAGMPDHREGSSRLALTPDNWLITPRLAVPANGIISYWIAAQDPSYPAEHYSVKLSTTNNQVASFTTVLFSETLSSGTWLYREIDLSAWNGQNVYIAFQHHDCYDMFYLKLDDIYMPPMAAPLTYGNLQGRVRLFGTDEGVVGATINIAGQSTYTGEDGTYAFTNLVVDTYQLSVTAPGCQNFNDNVTLQTNQTITLDIYLNYAKFNAPQSNFTMNCVTGTGTSTGATIQNTGNYAVDWDTGIGVWGGTTYLQGNMNQTWEDFDMTDWSGSVGPNTDIYSGYGYLSSAVWVFSSYGTTSPQYIISPRMNVLTGDALSFWYREFNASDESLNILVSTTDNNIGSFTNFATIGPLADNAWYNFSQSLDEFAGMNIYICFQYPRVDNYQYGYILLDTITGPHQYLPAMNWLSCTPDTGNLGASGSTPITLNVNATDVPVGTYTAQTWFFGNAVNEPYKLNVTLNVTAPLALDPPQNLVHAVYGTHVEFGWDAVDNAVGYRVYGSSDPYGEYTDLLYTEDNYAEFTWAQLAAFGLGGDHTFFYVKGDTSSPRSTIAQTVVERNASPQLNKVFGRDRSRVLMLAK